MTLTFTWVHMVMFLILLPFIKTAFDRPTGGYFDFPPVSTILTFIVSWTAAITIGIMKFINWINI